MAATVPAPIQLLFTFATGVVVALAARAELRGTPKTTLSSPTFAAYLVYAGLVVVPASLYFYLFHGDWYLLYVFEAQRIPSALVLLGCVFEVAIGALGFLSGASFVRNQRELWAAALVFAAGLLGALAVFVGRPRLSVVGTYAQFHGDFGLAPFGGALLQGVACMSTWMLIGLAYLAYRTGAGARR